MGSRQCLPLSVVQQKAKHCQKPHCRYGVVDTFGLSGLTYDPFHVTTTLVRQYHLLSNLTPDKKNKASADLKIFYKCSVPDSKL